MSEQNLIKRWKNLKQPVLPSLVCPVCGNCANFDSYIIHKATDMFHAGELIRYECLQCDAIFGDMRMLGLSRKEVAADYGDLYSYYKEGDSTKYMLQIFSFFVFPKSKTYLDWACGNSNSHIAKLRTAGYDIDGYDPFVGEFKTPPSREYDVVVSNNFIEHVIEPYRDLLQVLRWVKPEGLVLFTSQCWKFEITHTHYHTFYFLGRSIHLLEQRLGMVLLRRELIKFSDGTWTIGMLFQKMRI